MQVERVRHDGRADDSDRESDGRPVTQLRDDGVKKRCLPVRRRDYEFPQIAEADDCDERGDQQFEWPETPLVERQDYKRHHSGNAHTTQQRDVKQQGDAQSTTEELRNVGCHSGDFRCYPHANHGPSGELFPTELRQIASGDDAHFGRHPLE